MYLAISCNAMVETGGVKFHTQIYIGLLFQKKYLWAPRNHSAKFETNRILG